METFDTGLIMVYINKMHNLFIDYHLVGILLLNIIHIIQIKMKLV